MKTHTPKIFICEFLQETNSFNPIKCGIDSFKARGILEGDELINSKATVSITALSELRKEKGMNIEDSELKSSYNKYINSLYNYYNTSTTSAN